MVLLCIGLLYISCIGLCEGVRLYMYTLYRHPVRHIDFQDDLLLAANIPRVLFPETDDGESMVHRRYRTIRHYVLFTSHLKILVCVM